MPDIKWTLTEEANLHLQKLQKNSYFNVCELNTISHICDLSPEDTDPEAYRIIHGLHCVNYSDMSDALRDVLPSLLKRYLGDGYEFQVPNFSRRIKKSFWQKIRKFFS